MTTVYVAGEVSLDYNDEYYSPAGDQCDGGILPRTVWSTAEEAKQWCIGAILAEIKQHSWRVGSDVAYDATYQTRWAWHYEQQGEVDADRYVEPYSTYQETFDYDGLLSWCYQNGKDVWDYLPRVYDFMPAEQ